MITSMNDSVIGTLVSGKYLKSAPSKPEVGCSYSCRGDLTDSGYVVCTLHGDVEGKDPGTKPL